jgi:hypothetical protein
LPPERAGAAGDLRAERSVGLFRVVRLVTGILLDIALLLPTLSTTVVFLAVLLGIPGGVAAGLPGIASLSALLHTVGLRVARSRRDEQRQRYGRNGLQTRFRSMRHPPSLEVLASIVRP